MHARRAGDPHGAAAPHEAAVEDKYNKPRRAAGSGSPWRSRFDDVRWFHWIGVCATASLVLCGLTSVYAVHKVFDFVDENFSTIDSELGASLVGWFKSGDRTTVGGGLLGLWERVVVVPHAEGSDSFSLSFDVSDAKEASFLYRRVTGLHGTAPTTFSTTIVDIGANDGLLSSNSYNFAIWGWNTVLIEPNPTQMALAKKNQGFHTDPYKESRQKGCYLEAAMSTTDEDGEAELFFSADAASMESHLEAVTTEYQADRAKSLRGGAALGRMKKSAIVPVLSVGSVGERCKLPTRFGILSIDVEGAGAAVLQAWLNSSYDPEYIVYEPMHSGKMHQALRWHGYRYVRRLGWNQIWERTPRCDDPRTALWDSPPYAANCYDVKANEFVRWPKREGYAATPERKATPKRGFLSGNKGGTIGKIGDKISRAKKGGW